MLYWMDKLMEDLFRRGSIGSIRGLFRESLKYSIGKDDHRVHRNCKQFRGFLLHQLDMRKADTSFVQAESKDLMSLLAKDELYGS